jgi:hypothetical protein
MIENFDKECKDALDVLKKFIDAMYSRNFRECQVKGIYKKIKIG